MQKTLKKLNTKGLKCLFCGSTNLIPKKSIRYKDEKTGKELKISYKRQRMWLCLGCKKIVVSEK